MLDKDKIEMKALMESAAVADYLTRLAEGFKSGAIVVEKDGESLTLTPAGTAEVEVEARVKKGKARFGLEVSWRTAEAFDEPARLKISAATPGVGAAGAEPVDMAGELKTRPHKSEGGKPRCDKAEGHSAEKRPARPESDTRGAFKAEPAQAEASQNTAVEKKPEPAKTPAATAFDASQTAAPGASKNAGK